MRPGGLGAFVASALSLTAAAPAMASEPALVAALQAQIKPCWMVPAEASVRAPPLTLTVRLKRDGSLDGEPQADWDPKVRQYHRPLLASASRAVVRCAPYSLPAGQYEAWKELRITFRVGS